LAGDGRQCICWRENTNAIGAPARKPTMGTSNNLQQRLDAYVVGDCNSRVLADELLAHCVAAPRASWEVLALLDQYHRRGKLPLELHRAISQSIQRRALGVDFNVLAANAADAAAPPPVAEIRADVEIAVDEQVSHEILRLRKELQASRSLAAAYLEQLKSVAWQRSTGEAAAFAASPAAAPMFTKPRARTAWRRPTRSVQGVAAAALLLALAATPRLGERDVQYRLRSTAPVHVPVPGRVSLAAETFLVQPGERSALIAVVRAEGTDGEISFVWWTHSAGARAGVDFRARAAERVSMPAGLNSLQLTVPILNNPARRHTELFYVEIGNPQGGAALGDKKRAAVFIMRP
jgi:hypothetical protein